MNKLRKEIDKYIPKPKVDEGTSTNTANQPEDKNDNEESEQDSNLASTAEALQSAFENLPVDLTSRAAIECKTYWTVYTRPPKKIQDQDLP